MSEVITLYDFCPHAGRNQDEYKVYEKNGTGYTAVFCDECALESGYLPGDEE